MSKSAHNLIPLPFHAPQTLECRVSDQLARYLGIIFKLIIFQDGIGSGLGGLRGLWDCPLHLSRDWDILRMFWKQTENYEGISFSESTNVFNPCSIVYGLQVS